MEGDSLMIEGYEEFTESQIKILQRLCDQYIQQYLRPPQSPRGHQGARFSRYSAFELRSAVPAFKRFYPQRRDRL